MKVFNNKLFCGHNEGTFIIKGDMAVKISDVQGGWQLIKNPQKDNLLIEGTYLGLSLLIN